jgi:hypothetical protein
VVELTITIDAGEGKQLLQKVHGVFAYCVNDAGKLLSLRGFWDVNDPRNAMTEIDVDNAAASQ